MDGSASFSTSANPAPAATSSPDPSGGAGGQPQAQPQTQPLANPQANLLAAPTPERTAERTPEPITDPLAAFDRDGGYLAPPGAGRDPGQGPVLAPATDPHPHPQPPRGRYRAPDEIWAEVRADYLAGLSAPACCRRYGVGLSALRDRAAREGWRRRDQPWVAPNDLDIEDEGVQLEEKVDGDLDRVEPSQLAWVAHRRMLRAVMRGQATEALRWNRVEQVMLAQEAELERLIQQDEFLRHHLKHHYEHPDADAPHDAAQPDASDASDASDYVLPSDRGGHDRPGNPV